MTPLDWTAPRIEPVNGIRLAFWERGAGFPVVLCHGFPELAFSWRHQLPALAAAGYRALAPDQRGYGLTERPARIEDYDLDHLTGDLAGLLDALGLERAVFAGHDWGGIVVWAMAQLHPGRVAGVIALNTPFQPRGKQDLVTRLREVFGPEHYIVHMQEPGVADALFAANVEGVLERLYRKPRSGRAAQLPPEQMARLLTLDAMVSGGTTGGGETGGGAPFLSPAEMAMYVDTFRRTGFTGGIHWYRNFRRNWERMANVRQEIAAPALMISAEHDLFLPPRLADGMERWVPNAEKHVIPNCGHWTQQEQPDTVNRLMLDWLGRLKSAGKL